MRGQRVSGFRKKLRQYRSLTHDDRRTLARAFIWLTAADIALHTVPLRQLMGKGDSVGRRTALHPQAIERGRKYARLIEVAARHHVSHPRCLSQSLVLHHWLCREGLPSELRIGVRKEYEQFRAHAWVELGAVVVNDSTDSVAAFSALEPVNAVRNGASRGEGW